MTKEEFVLELTKAVNKIANENYIADDGQYISLKSQLDDCKDIIKNGKAENARLINECNKSRKDFYEISGQRDKLNDYIRELKKEIAYQQYHAAMHERTAEYWRMRFEEVRLLVGGRAVEKQGVNPVDLNTVAPENRSGMADKQAFENPRKV